MSATDVAHAMLVVAYVIGAAGYLLLCISHTTG